MIRLFSIDRQSIFQEGLKSIFEQTPGMHLEDWATDIRTATDRIKQIAVIDLVLMDLDFNDSTGINSLIQIKNLLPNTKILILTDNPVNIFFKSAIRAGAEDVLSKSETSPEILVKTITRIINGEPISEKNERKEFHDRIKGKLTFSPREAEVCRLLLEGKSSSEISRIMNITPQAVYTFKKRAFRKFGIKNNIDLARFFQKLNLTV